MFSQDYRQYRANQHVSVVKFVELFLNNNDSIIFDRMQRKRNSSVYETAGSLKRSVTGAHPGHDLSPGLVRIRERWDIPVTGYLYQE